MLNWICSLGLEGWSLEKKHDQDWPSKKKAGTSDSEQVFVPGGAVTRLYCPHTLTAGCEQCKLPRCLHSVFTPAPV